MKIKRGLGDEGQTSIYTGAKFKKHSLIIRVIGNIDELSSYIGLCRAIIDDTKMNSILFDIQKDLYIIMSNLAGAEINFNKRYVNKLEKNIEYYEKNLVKTKNYIIPSGDVSATHLYVARTICRRAERTISQINENEGTFPIELMYINRVSDLLMILGRNINKKNKIRDEIVK